MTLVNPWVGRKTINDKGKTIHMETNDEIVMNNSSLVYLEDWDLANRSNGLAKLQHKLQQIVHIVDQMLEIC